MLKQKQATGQKQPRQHRHRRSRKRREALLLQMLERRYQQEDWFKQLQIDREAGIKSEYAEITLQLILQGKTGPGGWKAAQLALIGIPFPPYSGWQESVIGGAIPVADAELFVDLRGKLNKTQRKAIIAQREEA